MMMYSGSVRWSRRQCLRGAFALLGATTLPACTVLSREKGGVDYTLEVIPQPIELIEGTLTPAWTFNGQNPAPILRLKQNRPVTIRVINRLAEPTTIHWHGIRLHNAADGVPYLTQAPIQPGEAFDYQFTCPDAGTFWYHPHMNSLEQLSRGLVGLLIVDEEQPVQFDADLPLMLKDWHLNPDGSFAAFSSPRAAARTGTLGNIPTINGQRNGQFSLPAGGWCRIRLANVDNTRVFNISCDHPAMVLAVEGNPLAEPQPLEHHPLGAGMRVDLAVKMPDRAGSEVQLLDQKGRFGFTLCRLIADAKQQARIKRLPRLPQNPVTPVDIAKVRSIPLVFEWAGALSPGFASASGDHSSLGVFWTANKRAWHSHGPDSLPNPLAEIRQGEHIIFELHNATPHHHPIHLHGYTFTVLSSDQRAIEPYHTDTVLMRKYERMRVAIVADNPGNWMFHCHVIEHMKTGLMGYIRVV